MPRERSRRARRARSENQVLTPEVVKIAQPLVNIPPYDMLSEEVIEEIQAKTLEILSDVGIDFYDEEARQILKDHGVRMRGDTAYFDREMVAEYIAMAPSQFTQQARDPDNNVVIGGNNVCFAPVYGPPFVHDLDRGRREATLEDFVNFVKLTYSSKWLHHSGGTIVEPTDLPTHTRHLDMVYSHIKYSSKAFMGSVTSGANAADSIAMAEIVFGKESIREKPAVLNLINISSPRRLDDRMLGALKEYARAGQALILTPFLFSGAMAPVGIAGTMVQMNAESLAAIMLTQMIRPGCPVIMGAFQTNIDLQSGAPVFGSPESQIALFTAAQLARYHGLPFRSGGHFASSKIPDAQSAYESIMVMLPAVLARVNFVLHAAGWLESGLAAGYEKFVLDNEQLGMFHKLLGGLDTSENGFAMDSLRSVAVTDHHLGTEHTMKNFRTAFHRSLLFDYNSFEQWAEEGSRRIEEKANEIWKQTLRTYEPPPLDPSIDEALQDFMSRRKKRSRRNFKLTFAGWWYLHMGKMCKSEAG